jgi:hypothetical protein
VTRKPRNPMMEEENLQKLAWGDLVGASNIHQVSISL